MKFVQQLLLTGLLVTSSSIFADGITIEDPYVREVPPGQMTSASFMIIKNTSGKDIALIKASSDVAKNVEIHEHVHSDGMMKMRQVKQIDVAANDSTILKPGGYHVMLIGLTRKIKAGDIINISLEFDNGDKKEIKAEVKEIMMGMMGSMKKDMQKMKTLKHINPMPNLMLVYKKMGKKLNLSKEQVSKLDAGVKERDPVIKELTALVTKIESDLSSAALNDKSLDTIDQLANSLMQERLAIIEGKTYCRESTKKVLNEKQFKTMVDLYRTNFSSKPKINPEQAEMAMKKHTNPMPNLMMVFKKMPEKLNLSEEQTAQLKQWGNERDPVMAKQYKAVMKLEADLNEAALNNEPAEKLAPISDGIMQVRMKIIRGKALCRDNMRRILDDKQYALVKELFKKNFMGH